MFSCKYRFKTPTASLIRTTRLTNKLKRALWPTQYYYYVITSCVYSYAFHVCCYWKSSLYFLIVVIFLGQLFDSYCPKTGLRFDSNKPHNVLKTVLKLFWNYHKTVLTSQKRTHIFMGNPEYSVIFVYFQMNNVPVI